MVTDPILSEVLTGDMIQDPHEAAIISMVNTTKYRVHEFGTPAFEILAHNSDDIIISDLPVLFQGEEYYMPVSPRHLLLMKKAKISTCGIVPVKSRDMIDLANDIQISNSRLWIAGHSETSLNLALSVSESKPFTRSLNIGVEEVYSLMPGWKLHK